MMNDLRKNAEGYNDPTAYNAMKNYIGGVSMDIKRGDIFYVSKGRSNSYGSEQEAERPAVIVSNDTGNYYAPVVEIVYLTTQEKKPMPTHVDVMCRVPSTALCEQIQTIYKDRLGDYIRSCTDEEMQAIDKALMVSLGLDLPLLTDVPEVERINKQEIDDLKKHLDGTLFERDCLLSQCEDKDRIIEEQKRIINELQAKVVDLKTDQSFAESGILEKENRRLAIKCELLQEQNEKLLDRLAG